MTVPVLPVEKLQNYTDSYCGLNPQEVDDILQNVGFDDLYVDSAGGRNLSKIADANICLVLKVRHFHMELKIS
ncbi:hypothetical protein JTB14_013945 [Gonioctena quinquepunctata]|nr:hypothetical protein JTB14_013945 [Gonioctena quinquepunctata]